MLGTMEIKLEFYEDQFFVQMELAPKYHFDPINAFWITSLFLKFSLSLQNIYTV